MVIIKKYRIVISILIILNLITLIDNYLNKKLILKYKNNLEAITLRFYDKGQLLNPTSHLYREIYLNPILVKPQKSIMLVALFNKHDCPVCIKQTVNILNEIQNNNNGILNAFYIGDSTDSSRFINKYDCNFPIHIIANEQELFLNEFDFPSTSVILIDNNNLIHSIYRAESNNKSKLMTFFKKVDFLLKNLENIK